MADPTDDRSDDAGTPLWVKAFGLIALLAVLLFVIVLLTGGPGAHGPGRHGVSGQAAAPQR